jgi:hypothetical protein
VLANFNHHWLRRARAKQANAFSPKLPEANNFNGKLRIKNQPWQAKAGCKTYERTM